VIRLAPFFLILLCLAAAAHATTPNKEDLDRLRERLRQLQVEYQSTKESQADASDALRESELAISEAKRRLRGLEAQQKLTHDALRQTGAETDRLKSQIGAQQEKLSGLLRNLYTHGEGDSLKLLLNGQNPNEIARNLHYLGSLSRAQAALIDSLRANLLSLSKLQETAKAKSQDLEQLKAGQQSEEERLLKERQSRQQVLSGISRQLKAQQSEMATLQRNEKRLTNLFERLAELMARREAERRERHAKALANRGTPSKRRGKLEVRAASNVPVAVNAIVPEAGDGPVAAFSRLKGVLRLPVQGELMNHFGAPREDGGPNWKGLFIRAASGSEVHAVAAGRVVFADWMRGFGNLIIVDHGQGYMSLYSNNESLYKQAGDAVKAGDVVASVGNSGGQAEAGVYFELRLKSRPINPMEWVK
jgi:murein hydrolase activator